ncbi:tripartite tricarboxylate transporter substrate binding protein [Reyranella sp. CPCC 100927]|uniref:Bug family tripartite tricarboxylate transporter substrate binding protein n=1 Tax=Reyranella sp. CPCC 100927 TaxID=2599616 RepID=UPI0011B3D2A2|nr:tripartite tricarboxylate transporter substrate binding protein [Reyranella sp. CPCC 100927]TWS96357.1 tripartite tricarboxylate transporter substrate binding protein [Reyranella sp. CPCC 100927]
MNIGRRRAVAAMTSLLCAGSSAGSRAQGLSDRPITIVVPFTAGTGIDILARLVGEHLRQRWDQPVVIDNKPGASGSIGTQTVARATPDGHTLMMTANTFVTNVPLYPNIGYDPVADFTPIAKAATGDLVLTVNPALKINAVAGFLQRARAEPGTMKYASPGVGTPQHLFMELFKLATKIDVVHVPYRGSAGAVQDVVAGHVGTMVMPLHTALPLERTAKIKLLAIGSDKRSPQANDVPTLMEEGITGFNVDLWYGLFAPARMPADLVARLNSEVNAILALDPVKAALREQGLVPAGGPPQPLAALVRADLAKWQKVIRDANIKPE